MRTLQLKGTEPALFGHWLVYRRVTTRRRLILYDLGTNQSRVIASVKMRSDLGEPDISGRRVVYSVTGQGPELDPDLPASTVAEPGGSSRRRSGRTATRRSARTPSSTSARPSSGAAVWRLDLRKPAARTGSTGSRTAPASALWSTATDGVVHLLHASTRSRSHSSGMLEAWQPRLRRRVSCAPPSSRRPSGAPTTSTGSATCPCWPGSSRARSRPRCPSTRPSAGEPLADILADVDRVLIPGITHWNHPGFMAYFGISGSPPGILGETIAAALNVNAMLWRTSPAATELEQRVLRWVAELTGLPPDWFGEITDTASASTMYALAAAREAAGLDIRTRGMAGRTDLPPLRVYTSDQAHSSVEKACIALGLGQEGLCGRSPTDAGVPDARWTCSPRPSRQTSPRACGRSRPSRPSGTTSTTSVDPVPAIADVCARARHVAARRRGVRRVGGGRPGDAPRARRLRAGRLARRQPAQVALHARRLQPALHRAAGRPAGRRSRSWRRT